MKKQTFRKHFQWYNTVRKHGQIGRITPQQKWNQQQNGIFVSSGEAETGNAGGQPARNSLMYGNDTEQVFKNEPDPSLKKSFLYKMPEKTQP